MGARIAPPFMEATDASRLVCVVVVSYQEFSLSLYAGCVSCEPVCVCVSLVRVVIICLASTHTALVSSPSLAVLHLSTLYVGSGCHHFVFFNINLANSSPPAGLCNCDQCVLSTPEPGVKSADA